MISQNELLDIICTEAIEYGGLQEIPGHKHGAKHSFHSAKRGARTPDDDTRDSEDLHLPPINYGLRLVMEENGFLVWKD